MWRLIEQKTIPAQEQTMQRRTTKIIINIDLDEKTGGEVFSVTGLRQDVTVLGDDPTTGEITGTKQAQEVYIPHEEFTSDKDFLVMANALANIIIKREIEREQALIDKKAAEADAAALATIDAKSIILEE